ncbi:hypothetical protein GM418_06085 [Maribellus comscasis]|uniref:Glycosyltransferase RgtA/B/C/D-like domain-containing protein n=1 Tax=Maribellus comscasis TaxID=2681766 RepID=A0A6I6JLM3_9BACT|nr:hypothetical protein [Maribellus comscasis]QGY43241.1 hypothetical protein GM418_06085 [Maribellus comscasis]
MFSNKYWRYSLLVLPLLFLWGGLSIHIAKYGNDPNYVYLANSIAIANGESVGYHDHPGTTVMQIGAVSIAVKHWFSNSSDEKIVTHVLKEPLLFMDAIQHVLVVMNFLILLFLGFFVLKKTNSVWTALLFQITGFLSANTLDHIWTKVEPEPVLFFITCIYVITILYFYFSENKNKFQYVIVFSLIIGAGLATKATFLPLIALPLIIIPSTKRKLIFIAGVIISFVLFTIPAIPEYKHMYYWFRDLTNHTGKYGQGEKGFIDISTYLPNMLELLKNNPVFGIVTGLGILTVALCFFLKVHKKNERANTWDLKILAGLIAANIMGVLVVSKHYIVHPDHYLIPELLLTGITIFFILRILLKSHKIVLPAIVIGLAVFLAFTQPQKLKYADYGYKITNEELDSTELMLERDYAEYTKIYYYPNSLNKYSALKFGDVYSKNRLLPYLKNLYPNTYLYNHNHGMFQNWNAKVSLENIVEFNGNKILLIGGPKDKNALNELENKGIPLNEIYKGRVQVIYELDTLRLLNTTSVKDTEVVDSCDFETTTKDGRLFLGTNGKPFGNASTRTEEVFKSGKHAVKVDSHTEFAIEYFLDGLKNGEIYEVTIWRKTDNNSARLVVGSVEPDLFYDAQNDYLTTDENGWEFLRLEFRVTPEMENKTLKIYIWNKDKKQAYFDDLTIRRISDKQDFDTAAK